MRLLDLAAVVLALLATANAHAVIVSPISWASQTINLSSASVNESNDIDLRVYKTSWASETSYLGSITGELTISFDYIITSEGWFEYPLLSIATGGAGVFSIPGCGNVLVRPFPVECGNLLGGANDSEIIDWPAAYSTKSGKYSTKTEVMGDSWVTFAIIPSGYSGNGDHFNTYLEIRNLSFDIAPAPVPVPEPETYTLMAAGLGVLGLMGRRRKSK